MPTSDAPAEIRRFTTLEAGRAVAAGAVVLHHATLLAAQPRFLGVDAFAGAPVFLNAGVDFFFVLSGFIIAFVHWGDLGRPGRLLPYAKARAVRIYPLYWAVLVPLGLVYAVFPDVGAPHAEGAAYLASSFLLAPTPEQPLLGVAWSLTYEILFYVLFAAAIAGGRRLLWLGVAWGAAIVGWRLAGGTRFPASFLLDPHNLQFLMGVACAAWLKTRRAPWPGVLLAAGVGGLGMVIGWAEPHGFADPLGVAAALGVAGSAVVLGAVELERSGRLRAPGWLTALGGASYAVYLVHVVAQSLSIHLLLRAGLRQPELLATALLVIGIGAGLACHLLVERPLLRGVRRWTGLRRPAAAGVPVAGSKA